MMGGDHQLYQEVLDLVEYWIPEKAYGHERKFQSELQEFLDEELNSSSSGGMFDDPLAAGGGGNVPVSTERGKSRADLAVDDTVGIELKRDLSNDQTKKLDGQINSYTKEYPYVIVCACGIDDMDGWRRVKNEWTGGMGFDQTEVAFVHKQKDNFGEDPDQQDGGGLFDGGIL